MVSAAARLMPLVQHLRGAHRRFRSTELTMQHIAGMRRYDGVPRLRGVEVHRVGDLVTIAPSEPSGVECLWWHGGSYTGEITPQHFGFARDVALGSRATITLPIYRLAPHQTAAATVAEAAALLVEHPHAVAGGDSAGGGLAVAAALAAASVDGVRRTTLLVAPWLDARLEDAAIPALEARDPWLHRVGLGVSMGMYRGDLPLDDPRVSPLLGDLGLLGPSTVVVSDRDLLLADARAFARRAAAAGVEVDLRVARGMIHDFPMLPIPEATIARRLLASRLIDAGGRSEVPNGG